MKRWMAIAAIPLMLSACDDGEETGDGMADDGMSARACDNEDRDDFAIGVERAGSTLTLEIHDAMPSDPIRGDNAWMVGVARDGEMLPGAEISVRPWMPDHGHGTPVEIGITDMGDGEYMLDPLNLFMAGLWEVHVTATLEDGTEEEVVFHACVE